MKKIKLLLSVIILLLLTNCDGNQKFLKELQEITKLKPQYDPVPPEVAARMQSSFKGKTFLELNKQQLLNGDEFILEKKEWLEICTFLQSNNKVSVIRLYFVQFDSNLNSKYTSLKSYDGKLYILLGYFDGSGQLINNKYYGMMSVNSGTIEITPDDFLIMHENYKKNIKFHINQYCITKNNTEYLSIDVIDFGIQQGIIKSHDRYENVKFKNLKFKLAEVVDPNSITIAKNKSYYVKKYNQEIGQLATLTDAIDSDGKVIPELENYDLNSLSPPN
ncbi:hypothetical protein [Chryseobacterium sp. YIM B08800]|uniref:hypothetical protein n=1 Tax=Chryseobacterium sp. YIM B08800 TaxID=2984136 RepID=UPI00224069C2|nr:hypothetical protein [Chryseobacterium sp. YIM B08800]